MSALVKHSREPIPLPAPRVPLHVRPAVPSDLPFMDRLQKMHAKQVGWMPTKQLQEKISAGHVLIADAEVGSCELRVGSEAGDLQLSTSNSQLSTRYPVGYVIGRDQYFKRDDVGIIYQMNVVPGCQRCLVGATLLQAMFARAAYGCRLFCCWCAQDIGANKFWEAMGFVPLAFRAGGERRGRAGQAARTHIFWQRRIRSGDTTTPWWFPSQTSSGAIREDRLVLPIPPGTHWSDVMPVILPSGESSKSQASNLKQIESQKKEKQKKKEPAKPVTTSISAGGLRFASLPAKGPDEPPTPPAPKPKKPKQKNDPKLIAAARELRDRWLEQINTPGANLMTGGKYEVSKEAVESTKLEVRNPRQITSSKSESEAA